MIIHRKDGSIDVIGETAPACHPKDNEDKYPMWIQVKRSDKELYSAHAHLYMPVKKPSKRSLITKFKISEKPPAKPSDIEVMPGKNPVPFDYAWMIIRWAREKNKRGINNWLSLLNDWDGLEKTFR
jgi:hypothetical protein